MGERKIGPKELLPRTPPSNPHHTPPHQSRVQRRSSLSNAIDNHSDGVVLNAPVVSRIRCTIGCLSSAAVLVDAQLSDLHSPTIPFHLGWRIVVPLLES